MIPEEVNIENMLLLMNLKWLYFQVLQQTKLLLNLFPSQTNNMVLN